MTDTSKYRMNTLALHAGQEPDPATLSRAVPIYATTSYLFKDSDHAADLFALKQAGNIYSRLSNPTCDVLERRLAAMEAGKAAVSFASGMAAISATVATLARAGQNIIAARSLYGGTVTLFGQTLPRLGIEARFFDSDKPQRIRELADADTRCVYIETLGNPRNDVPDFEQIAAIAHELGVPLVVDNTVMTAVGFRPLEHGADIVVYSTTKFIGGHGVHVGGAVVDGGRFNWQADAKRWPEFCADDPAYHGLNFARAFGDVAFAAHVRTHWLRDTGACMSPFAAFLFLLGLETQGLRIERHFANAQAVAQFLAAHKAVEWVNYPGLPNHPQHDLANRYLTHGKGAMIGFGIRGGREAGKRFINAVKLASHLANIGDAKTLVIHPASTTHQQLTDDEQRAAGVSPEYIRLSVGLEDVHDIIEDLDQALKAAVR